SEECAEEETFETQKAETSEGFPDPQQRAVQRVPAGEFESFTDTTPESTPSSLWTAPDQLVPSGHPGTGHSPVDTRSVPGGGRKEEGEFRVSLRQDSPASEAARDLCETTFVRSQLDSALEPPLKWETMAQNQGSQQGAPRTTGLPPTSLKTRPASPKASRAGLPQPTTPLTPRRKLSTPAEYRDTVPSEYEDKVKRPKVWPGAGDQLAVLEQTRRASSCSTSPTHSRSGSRTFDRMRYLETFPERRRSFELADGQPWPGFRKSRSFDHADQREGRGRPSFSDLLESEGRGLLRADSGSAEQKRLFFRQKAASFDERGKYASRARDVELKISEELSRIKKTAMCSAVRPVLRSPVLERAVNRELSSRKALTVQRIEPLSIKVLQWPGLRSPERTQPEPTPSSVPRKPLQRGLATVTGESEDLESLRREKARAQEAATNHFDQRSGREGTGEQPTQSPQPPTQPPSHPQPVLERVEKVTSSSESRAPITISLAGRDKPEAPAEGRWKVRAPSPHFREATDSLKAGLERLEGARLELQPGDAAPQLGLAPLSPACATVTRGPGTPIHPGLKTAVSEKKDTETGDLKGETRPLLREKSGRKTPRGKSKKSRPTSPELAESSDDSYVSAGEDPLEPPVFEISIADTLVTVGASVLLKCIVTGTPIPQVSWKKDGELLKTSQTHVLKAEGERHTLFIPSASTLDGGLYSVSAANEVGLASCCASVQVRADSTADRRSLPIPTELYSPITSDEEYLSPLEEPVDLTYKGKQALRLPEICEQQSVYEPQSVIETHFKAPPSFQVPLSDQVAVEGQNISLTVCVLGEPKPIIYWLRNREPVKVDSRHYVLEGENGRFHLNIVSVQRSDSGMYSCKAINEYGTKQCDGKLEIKGESRIILL
ncbi:striated muscle-specific serine/threonine-protein kinase-like, partial [Mustelus asterias]